MFFDPEDINKIMNSPYERMPDGMVDASSFVNLFHQITSDLLNTDSQDDKSRMTWMLSVVNHLDQMNQESMTMSSVEIISCLCFHTLTLYNICHAYDSDFIQKYVEILNESIMPEMRENGTFIPYWD
jgi:hypothetical protein